MIMQSIVLASASPRRKELLEQVAVSFIVDAASINEHITKSDPKEYVKELSRRKAEAVAQKHPGRIVLGADTVVVSNGEIMGKPKDERAALAMLYRLSGHSHKVYTGVTLYRLEEGNDYEQKTFVECTEVVMFANDEPVLREYIATGEPMDKAGAYGIQGKGALLVKEIHGDYNNVVGLPVARVVREILSFKSDFFH